MPLRIVGVDSPGGGLAQKATPQQQAIGVSDITTQALQGAQQAQQQTIQTLRKQTEVQGAVAEQKVAIQQQSGATGDFFYDAVKTAGGLFDSYLKIKGKKDEQAAAINEEQKKVRQEFNFANASQEIRDAAFGLRTELDKLGREKGTEVARQRLADILVRYNDISPDAHRQLTNFMYDAIDKVDREFFDEGTRNQRDLREAQVGQAAVEVDLHAQEILSEISRGTRANDPESIKQAMWVIETKATQVSDRLGFDELQSTSLKLRYMRRILESREFSENAKSEAAKRMKDLTEFQSVTASIKQAGLPPDMEKGLVDAARLKYNQNGNTDPLSATDALKQQVEYKQTVQQLQELERKEYLEKGQAQKIASIELTRMALSYINDPSRAWEKEQLKRTDPLTHAALEGRQTQVEQLIKNTREQQKDVATLTTKIGKLRGTLQEIQQAKNFDAETMEKLRKTGWNVDWSSETTIAAELQGLEQQLNTITGPLTQDLATLGGLGVIMGNDGRYTLAPGQQTQVDNAKQMIESSGVRPPDFNSGGAAIPQPTALKPASDLAKIGDVGLVPFLPKDQGVLSISSGYGMRQHPIHGTEKLHDGIDISGPTGTPIVAVKSGRVIRSEINGSMTSGFGNYVEVEHADGTVTGYAHLDTRTVKVGDVLAQGQKLGTLGSTGGSTGPHLHFGVYPSKSGKGIAPIPFLRSVQRENGTQVARGMGLPPQQSAIGTNGMYRSENAQALLLAQSKAPAGSVPLPTGGYVFQGRVYLPDGQFQQAMQYSGRPVTQPANNTPNGTGGGSVGQPSPKQFNSKLPMVGTRASGHVRDYKGKSTPDANYGYKTLANDKDFARALASTANRLGFPAVWLADIMAFESTQNGVMHNPAATNSAGAVGLIQFYPGGGLAEVAQDMGVGEDVAADRLRSMTRAQQMRHVEKYLQRRIDENGRFKRIDDLFASIFGGSTMVRQSDTQRQNSSDGNISYKDYLNNIGHHVGRKYHHGLMRGSDKPRTHTSYVSTCPTCSQMMSSDEFTPHKHTGSSGVSPLSQLRL
jgi:murein DD-endopeptidase MepM/ murein hydrolase activator NlpD